MKHKKVKAVGVAVYVYFVCAAAALADSADYGKRAGQWASGQLQAVWLAAIAAGACMFLFPGSRKPGILLGYIAAVFLTGFVLFNPAGVEKMIKNISNVITG